MKDSSSKTTSYMRIVIFGPQGSGKGTQAELIARRHGLPYISTGDIFRYHTTSGTPLGMQVQAYTARGELVPDVLTNEIVKDRIQQPDCEAGFVIDGYPRNQVQADFLSSITKVDVAFVIELSDEEAIARLSQRLACKCGLSYHAQYNPPKVAGQCDKCGGVLFRREDDQPQAIRKRLAIYHTETEPVLSYYENQKILHRIDGARLIDEVYQQIEKALV